MSSRSMAAWFGTLLLSSACTNASEPAETTSDPAATDGGVAALDAASGPVPDASTPVQTTARDAAVEASAALEPTYSSADAALDPAPDAARAETNVDSGVPDAQALADSAVPATDPEPPASSGFVSTTAPRDATASVCVPNHPRDALSFGCPDQLCVPALQTYASDGAPGTGFSSPGAGTSAPVNYLYFSDIVSEALGLTLYVSFSSALSIPTATPAELLAALMPESNGSLSHPVSGQTQGSNFVLRKQDVAALSFANGQVHLEGWAQLTDVSQIFQTAPMLCPGAGDNPLSTRICTQVGCAFDRRSDPELPAPGLSWLHLTLDGPFEVYDVPPP